MGRSLWCNFNHEGTLEVLIDVAAASCRFYLDSNQAAGCRFFIILLRTKIAPLPGHVMLFGMINVSPQVRSPFQGFEYHAILEPMVAPWADIGRGFAPDVILFGMVNVSP